MYDERLYYERGIGNNMKKIKAGLYCNGKYQIFKDKGYWYVYSKYVMSYDKTYDNYMGMYKTLKAALKSLNLELDKTR